MQDNMSFPNATNIEILLSQVHDLRGRIIIFMEPLERIQKYPSRSSKEDFDHKTAALLQKLEAVQRAALNVLRASRTTTPASDATSNLVQVDKRPLNILWVDDDALHISRFGGFFQDAMWRVTSATTVDKALELVVQKDFDAVIVDLIMPHGALTAEETAGGLLTGLALARRIRKHHENCPIVFLTVDNSAEVATWCRENPPAMILFKSQLARDTVRKVEALIRYRSDSSLDEIEFLLERVPWFVRAIAQRHNGRQGLNVSDEYDIQDILRGVLALKLQDVREEEWSPSYAGGGSRIDFLLPQTATAIEAKMTRRGLNLKQLGEQLLVDIARYKVHPDVRALVCFVVDAANVVKNPIGFVADLRRASTPDLEVRAVVVTLNSGDGISSTDLLPKSKAQRISTKSKKRGNEKC